MVISERGRRDKSVRLATTWPGLDQAGQPVTFYRDLALPATVLADPSTWDPAVLPNLAELQITTGCAGLCWAHLPIGKALRKIQLTLAPKENSSEAFLPDLTRRAAPGLCEVVLCNAERRGDPATLWVDAGDLCTFFRSSFAEMQTGSVALHLQGVQVVGWDANATAMFSGVFAKSPRDWSWTAVP